jgi:hypothetical protein
MRNVLEKSRGDNQKTFNVQKHFSEDNVVYEVTWKNMVEPEKPQMTM